MSWESNPAEEKPEDVKDRTKLLWGIVIGSVVIMAVLLAIGTRPASSGESRAYVKHIYVPFDRERPEDRERALELMLDVSNSIQSGELSFEEAAEQYSSERGIAERGGHLGWVTRDDLADGKAKEYVWEGPVGELSPILESNTGFHLILVTQRELSARERYERELKERVIEGRDEAGVENTSSL